MRKTACILVLASFASIIGQPPAVATERAYDLWEEALKSGPDEYFGVRANWNDTNWSGIPCPAADGQENFVYTFVKRLR